MSQRLSSIFAGNTTLRALARKGQELSALDRLFRKAVPVSLARASRVIGLEHHLLKVGADNSAVAAKLRQLAPEILQSIQKANAEVTGILVKVQVVAPTGESRHRARTLGNAGKHEIAELASTLDNSPLKSALLRLIKR